MRVAWKLVVCGSVWLVGLVLAPAGIAQAGNLEKLADDALKHVPSGWVFPKTIGEFQRGEVQEISGTHDVAAQYDANGLHSRATVYVYPPDSPAGDASLAGARAAIKSLLKSTGLAETFSEGPFRAGKAPLLVGEKTFFKIGVGPDTTMTNLYYFDTGKWVVKLRLSVDKVEKATFPQIDNFVREQRWDSLGLSVDNCTGAACRVERPIPLHGRLPEQLAILLLNSKVSEVFPKELPECDVGALQTALGTANGKQGDAPQPIRVAAACAPKKGVRASFLRMEFDQEIRDSIEMQSPDGLSLRGPMTFVVLNSGKSSIYTQMYDGSHDAASLQRMLAAFGGEDPVKFATADKHGKDPQPVMRFIE